MSAAITATARLKSVQRIALTMLVVAGAVNYIDRATLAVANPLIRQDLRLSIADMGYLLSAFLWAYAFAQLPTGAWSIDRRRACLTCGLSLWSLAQVLGGLVQGFGEFFGARMLLGIGEAPQFPTCARVVAGLVQSARSRPRDGHLQLRLLAGHGDRRALADIPDAVLRLAGDVHHHGRRGSRHGGDLVSRLSQPDRGRTRRRGECLSDAGRPAGPANQGHVARVEAAVPVPHHLGHDPGLFRLHLSDLDLHRLAARLSRDRAAHEREVHRLGGGRFPSLGACVGGVTRRISSPTFWCAAAVSRSRAADIRPRSPCSAQRPARSPRLTSPANALAIAFISASLFLVYVTSTCAWALSSVAAPTNCTASIGAMQNFGGYLGGALAPTVTGLIVQSTGTFVPALVVGALIGVASAASYLFVVRDVITEVKLVEIAGLHTAGDRCESPHGVGSEATMISVCDALRHPEISD